MLKSQKKAANSYSMNTINSYIMNWPLKRTVINPISQIGGSPIFKRPRLRQPLIPQRAPPIPPPRRRPVFTQRERPVPKPRILSKRPTPAPRNFIP